ncbi:hypothetical protein APHAL10511_001105 [Amanita phalloides]|nr:hypothetical protein APHAL10511_001105 [Amanita phalloides]
MPSSDTLSQTLGYVSIACWLGAQVPQIYKNFRLQSCEGLSLMFLLNWYLGDCSNLIGCILTNQLPFQTWLAAYFVCVDTTLLFQYFYYTQPVKPSEPYREHAIPAPQQTIRAERTPSRYRTISAVAANVAAAAALAAQHHEQGHSRHHYHRQRRHMEQSHDIVQETTEMNEDFPTKLVDSFYSEDGQQKRVSWSIERHRLRGGSLGRHSLVVSQDTRPARPNTAAPVLKKDLETLDRERTIGPADEVPQKPSTGHRRNSRTGRSSASLVFLGVWALFGFGKYGTGEKYTPPGSSRTNAIGRVLGASLTSVAPVPYNEHYNRYTQLQQHNSGINVIVQDKLDYPHPHRIDTWTERFLGRIFAWLCTTLYLTCRLPQIWKNYVRKSVDGLSISLFIFAFLGNVFYVSSILVSPRFYLPPPLSTEYIQETVPYLLGSAGTLMFDVTIIVQFILYRPHRHRSLIDESLMSEETGLLTGGQTHYHVGEHRSRGRTSYIKAT